MWDARIRSRSLRFGSSTIGSWNWYVKVAQGNRIVTLRGEFLMYSGTESLLVGLWERILLSRGLSKKAQLVLL